MNKKEKKVHEKVILLGNFYKEYGREPKAKEEYNGMKIGYFLHNIRKERIKINELDIVYLEQIGINLIHKSRKEKVHEKVLLLGEFYKKYGREPNKKEEYNGIKIGVFFNNILSSNTTISEKDKKYLKGLGVRLISENRKEKVHEKVLLLGEFYKKYGRKPDIKEEYKGIKIGIFYYNVHSGNTTISEKDEEYLESLGITFKLENEKIKIHEKVLLLGKFYKEFSHVPKLIEEYEGVKIGCFFHNIRTYNTRITKEDRIYLQNLGIKL